MQIPIYELKYNNCVDFGALSLPFAKKSLVIRLACFYLSCLIFF